MKPFCAGDRVFRDPVHGLIEFVGDDRPLGAILETRAFQRLRRIHQMGFAWWVYPGAEHTRFGHALGAFHIATRVVEHLQLEARVARHVRIAALVHDIGHGPFSHTWEQVFAGFDHESWGGRLCTEDPELSETLSAIEPGLPVTLASFADKSYKPAFARKLVSSQLDVDRLDYLLRDGHYSGAGYATFDLEWILHALRLDALHEGDDPNELVVDYRRGMYAVEQYLFARSYMYAQVYHHKTVRAAERMFAKLLGRYAYLAKQGEAPEGLRAAEKLVRGESIDTSEFCSLDDFAVTQAVDGWAGYRPGQKPNADRVLHDLAHRFSRRRLFKTLDLGSDHERVDDLRQQIGEIARKRFGDEADYYYQVDSADQLGYRAPQADEELYVVGHPTHGTVSLGRLLRDMPLGRPTSTIRLVCAEELVDDMAPIARQALGPVSQ